MKLSDSINKVRGVGVKKAAAFARIGIRTRIRAGLRPLPNCVQESVQRCSA